MGQQTIRNYDWVFVQRMDRLPASSHNPGTDERTRKTIKMIQLWPKVIAVNPSDFTPKPCSVYNYYKEVRCARPGTAIACLVQLGPFSNVMLGCSRHRGTMRRGITEHKGEQGLSNWMLEYSGKPSPNEEKSCTFTGCSVRYRGGEEGWAELRVQHCPIYGKWITIPYDACATHAPKLREMESEIRVSLHSDENWR